MRLKGSARRNSLAQKHIYPATQNKALHLCFLSSNTSTLLIILESEFSPVMSTQGRFRHRLRQFDQDGPQKDQRESKFGPAMFMKLPLISLYLRACIYECPTALDLSFCTFPDIGLFLLAGLFDYCIVSLACFVAELFSPAPSTLQIIERTMLFSSLLWRLYIIGWNTVLLCVQKINCNGIRPYGTISVFMKACPAAFWTLAISWFGFDTARHKNWILSIATMYLYGFWSYIDASAMLLGVNSTPRTTDRNPPGAKSWTSVILSAFKSSVVAFIIQKCAKYTPAFILYSVYIVQSIQTEFHAQPEFRTWGLDAIINFLDRVLPLQPLEGILVFIWQTIYIASFKLRLIPFIIQALERGSIQPAKPSVKVTGTTSSNTKRFRLLTIHPGSSDSQMQCSWDWFDLEAPSLSYTALSYVWGSSERCCEININGNIAFTTKSAVEALNMLRSSREPKTVWVDAICIDQDDRTDQEHEIPHMTEIYRNATHVVVWLGHAEDGYLATGLASTLWFRATLAKEFGGVVPIKDIHRAGWKALTCMLSAKWFQRVWIIQEVVVAKDRYGGHSVIVRYGNGTIDWETFSWFVRECLTDPAVLERLLFEDATGRVVVKRTFKPLRNFDQYIGCEGPNLSLLYYPCKNVQN